jgi:hypothetical protein
MRHLTCFSMFATAYVAYALVSIRAYVSIVKLCWRDTRHLTCSSMLATASGVEAHLLVYYN